MNIWIKRAGFFAAAVCLAGAVSFPALALAPRLRELKPPVSMAARPVKVLLIQPRDPTSAEKPTRFPLGLMNLASVLMDQPFMARYIQRKYGDAFPFRLDADLPFTVDILDLQGMRLKNPGFDLAAFLRQGKYDVVGVSAVTPLITTAAEIARTAKKALPQAMTVVGGVHVSALPQDTMRRFPVFDVGVIGQGEEPLLDLVLQRSLGWPQGDVQNTCRLRSRIVINPIGPRVMRLDEMPLAVHALDLLDKSQYQDIWVDDPTGRPAGVLMSSTGCPGGCIFCGSHIVFPKPIQLRSADSMMREVRTYYERYGITGFFVVDDVFTLGRQRVIKFCDDLVAYGREVGKRFSFVAMTRPDCLTEDVVRRLKEAGCRSVALGVETGDEDLLKGIGKNSNLQKVREATVLLKKYGIPVKYYLMVGLPGQRWQSIERTAQFLMETLPDGIDVSVAMPYPGTGLWKSPDIRLRGDIWNFNLYMHDVPPQLKVRHTAQTLIRTETDVMTPEQIAQSRDYLWRVFEDVKRLRALEIAA